MIFNYKIKALNLSSTVGIFDTIKSTMKEYLPSTKPCYKVNDLANLNPSIEGEQKKSTQTVLSLEAISYARVLQSPKISCLLLDFL